MARRGPFAPLMGLLPFSLIVIGFRKLAMFIDMTGSEANSKKPKRH